MGYTSFRIKKDLKVPGKWKVSYDGTQSEVGGMKGNWTSSGAYCDLYRVPGGLVQMNVFKPVPIAVFKNVSDFIQDLAGKYECPIDWSETEESS